MPLSLGSGSPSNTWSHTSQPPETASRLLQLFLRSSPVCGVVWPVLTSRPSEGRKTHLAWMAGYIPRWYARPKTVTHPSTNRARRRVTSLIRPTMLPLRQTAKACEISNLWQRSFRLFISYCLNTHTHIQRTYRSNRTTKAVDKKHRGSCSIQLPLRRHKCPWRSSLGRAMTVACYYTHGTARHFQPCGTLTAQSRKPETHTHTEIDKYTV